MRTQHEEAPKLSRADVETLCILEAIRPGGNNARDLTARLGLHRSLSDAVAQAALGLINSGFVRVNGEIYSLTAQGESFLGSKLATLDLD